MFTQTDPLEPDVGSPYPSAYVYGNNNPLVYTDPSGLRGQLAGCDYGKNPIASQQPELMALRTQIQWPVPGTLPPFTVPPRRPRPEFPGTRPPVTVRPRPTTTTSTIVDDGEEGSSTTQVRPSTSVETPTTLKGKVSASCKGHRAGPGKCSEPQVILTATGSGKNQAEAEHDCKKNLDAQAGRGCYVRHVQCKKPSGGWGPCLTKD